MFSGSRITFLVISLIVLAWAKIAGADEIYVSASCRSNSSGSADSPLKMINSVASLALHGGDNPAAIV